MFTDAELAAMDAAWEADNSRQPREPRQPKKQLQSAYGRL
jgi:hypothetical protein